MTRSARYVTTWLTFCALLSLAAVGFAGDEPVARLPEPHFGWDKMIPASLPADQDNTALIAKIQRVVRDAVAANEPLLPLYFPTYAALAADLLDLKPGDTVADIGSGLGAFEVAVLTKKQPLKRLYSVDVDAQALALQRFVIDHGRLDPHKKVKYVTSTFADVKLPAGEIDVAVIVAVPFVLGMGQTADTIVKKPGEMNGAAVTCLASIQKALSPTGRFHDFSRVGEWDETLHEPYQQQAAALYEHLGFTVVSKRFVLIDGVKHSHIVLSR